MSVLSVKINDTLCINPFNESQELKRALIQTGLKFNGFHFRAGRDYGYGDLLLLKKDITTAMSEAIDNTLVIDDGVNSITVSDLILVNTRRLAPTDSDNDILIARFADARFFSQKNPCRNDVDPFPVHEKYDTTGETFESTWDDAIDEYWDKSNTQVSSSEVDQTNANYPSNLFKDVRTPNTGSYWETLNHVLHSICHDIYKIGQFWHIIANEYILNVTNSNLVLNNTDRLLSLRTNESADYSRIPESVDVKYRKEVSDSIFWKHLVRNRTYAASGGASTVRSGLKREIHLWNVYDPNHVNAATYLTSLNSLGDQVGDLFFNSFDNHLKYNAVYFGVIPFEHGPDAHEIIFFHDLIDMKYKTIVRSLNMNEWEFPEIDRSWTGDGDGESQMLRFALTDVFEDTDVSTTDFSVQQYYQGTPPASDPTVLYDDFPTFSGQTGAKGYAFYDSNDDEWIVYQMTCIGGVGSMIIGDTFVVG